MLIEYIHTYTNTHTHTRINNIYFPHAVTSVTRGEGVEGRGKDQNGNERDVSGRNVLNFG